MIASVNGSRQDGALYWMAYALNKVNRRSEALSVIEGLKKGQPKSRWLNDAKALAVEMAQSAGKPIRPEEETDNDIKLMAINSHTFYSHKQSARLHSPRVDLHISYFHTRAAGHCRKVHFV